MDFVCSLTMSPVCRVAAGSTKITQHSSGAAVMCSTPRETTWKSPSLQHDVGTVAIADDENALADEEELVLLGVAVPDELALDLGDLHELPVGGGDDPRRPVLGEPLEFAIDVQRLSPSIESRAGKGDP